MTDIPETVTLDWIARRLVSLQNDVSRLDITMSLIVADLRAMRSQHNRLRTRVKMISERTKARRLHTWIPWILSLNTVMIVAIVGKLFLGH
jgi:hypothetical protein